MATSVDQHYVNAYNNNVTLLFQQKGSKLKGRIREKQSTGEYEYFDRLHPTAAQKRTERFANTVHSDVTHDRRRAEKSDYDWSVLVDPKTDLHRMLVDPTSDYATLGSWGMGRAFDDEIILAFTADAVVGKTGGSTVAFPTSTQQIAEASLNLNWQKLIDAKLIFAEHDIEDSELNMIISPSATWSLLQQTQVNSIDHNAVKALVDASVSRFAGFNFLQSNRLPKATDTRSCYAWHPMSMGVVIGNAISSTIDRLPERNNSIQILTQGSFGAVRILDEGVVEILIDEAEGPA